MFVDTVVQTVTQLSSR